MPAVAQPLQRKLSSKIIMGQTVNATLLGGLKVMALYVIAGIARQVETGESDSGPWTAFKGEFIAKRASDGETFKSFKAFVPEPLQSMLLEQLGTVDDKGRPIGDDGKPVKRNIEFAAEVGIELVKDSSIGFQYTATPVLDVQESDQLGGLLERASLADPKMLPAPAAKRSRKKDNE